MFRSIRRPVVYLILFLSAAASVAGDRCDGDAVADASYGVDYRYYSLDSWIGAIGLPDDCFKCVVDADGQFLTEFGNPQGHPGVYPPQNRLGIRVDLLGGVVRVDQRMHSPRAPIAITRKRQGDVAITERLFLARPLDWNANVKGEMLKNRDSKPDCRQYLLMVEYANEGDKAAEITPVIHVAGAVPATRSADSRQTFAATANTQCWTSDEIASFESREADNDPFVFGTAKETFEFPGPHQATVTLKKITIAPGGKAQCVVAIHRNGFQGDGPVGWVEAAAFCEQAIAYWEKSTLLPYDVIQVPDPEIQALLDTSIRELFQMRYVSGGLPVHFFGPGAYNDYWVLDSNYVIEALAMLGRVEDASGCADYMLTRQQDDGRIQNMANHWKETGVALLTFYNHARLIQDKNWLLERWPQFTRAVGAIEQLRRTGTSADSNEPNFKLSPPGFGDGGILNEVEYTNNHWLLAGMKAAVEAARWLDKSSEADAWEKEYRDFEEAYQKAINRDAKTDAAGNRYIPVLMGPVASEHPTRGQWAFCQGVYPGRIFAHDDPLMLGTMKMLATHEVQGGIVEDSGWIGVWAQSACFYGHDWLWLGNGRKASGLLYAFANHASPLRNWREEMPKQTKPNEVFPFDRGSGGMPHVSAAAEFIRLTGHLLAFDRGDELHLFEGLPPAWLKPGMTTRLSGMRTVFGPLTLELKVASDGQTASLHIAPLSDPACRKIVVHVGGWASQVPGAVEEFAPNQPHERTWNLEERKPHPFDEGERHTVRQLNGEQEAVSLPAEIQWINMSWDGERAGLPYLVYMPEKDRLLLSVICGPESFPSFRPCVTTSDDHGKTWSHRQRLGVDQAGKPTIGWLLGLTYLEQGKLLAFAGGLDSVASSSDFGQTWQTSAPKTPPAEIWEPLLVARRPDGQIDSLAITSWKPTGVPWGSSDGPYAHGYLRCSSDLGQSWSEPAKIPQWLGVSEANLIVAKNGDWVAACRTDSPKRFAHNAFDHYSGLGVSISKDQGKSWSDVNLLYEWGRHHPSMVRLSDGRIVMSYIVRLGYPDTPDGFPQFGVEAVVSDDNGQTWDLEHRYILARWIGNIKSGVNAEGEWTAETNDFFCGPQCSSTVCLPDGMLLTAFSAGFRTMPEAKAQIMDVAVVRWRLHP